MSNPLLLQVGINVADDILLNSLKVFDKSLAI